MSGHSVRRGSMLVSAAVAGVVAFAFKDQYNAPVTYSWDGSEVAQEGEIPKAEGN